MKAINKTAKNLEVGDFIALNINDNGGKYAVGKNRINQTTIFSKIVSFGAIRIAMGNVTMIEITCADGSTYEVESNASRFATEVK